MHVCLSCSVLPQQLNLCAIAIIFTSNVHFYFGSNGINLTQKYTTMSDDQLDNKVKQLLYGNQQVGANSVIARLASQGINVQRERIRESMQCVDAIGVALRGLSGPVNHRHYFVPSPNSIWHVDGNHKLVRSKKVRAGEILLPT